MNKIPLSCTVNGKAVEVMIKPYTRLLDFIREDLGLTGTKEGCGVGECGCCTVIMDGEAVNSCHTLAAQAHGKEIITTEGLIQEDGSMHPIQNAYVEKNAIQCGFCTPGFVMATKALLDKNPTPTDEEIEVGLSGNICRCTGYEQIVDAVKMASDELSK